MRIKKIDVLGKDYRIQTELKNHEMDSVNSDINRRLSSLVAEYPSIDKIDILVLYIIELNEKIFMLERKEKSEREKLEKISSKVDLIEEKIKKEIENLDNV